LTSELCQTVGGGFFFYLSYLFESWQNIRFAKKIKFGKLLEMLLAGSWWLVLIWCKRKVLLVGGWWLTSQKNW
jgi:hypothetical protein